MPKDKYTAVWVSPSSIGDFLKCPRTYYLHNVYKDPKTGRKINIVNPAFSLGHAVHETLEGLKNIPVDQRNLNNLLTDFEKAWKKVSGKKGGFSNEIEEAEAKSRGRAMIQRVISNPGPIAKRTVPMPKMPDGMLLNYFLSEEENIILCGLIDWLEYVDADDSIRVLDFKTGRHDADEDSMQLPIYVLLLHALQKRKVSGIAYWYLDRHDEPVNIPLPEIEEARNKVIDVALKIKNIRAKKEYDCPRGKEGCFACQPYEAILSGEAEYVGADDFNRDNYYLTFKNKSLTAAEANNEILSSSTQTVNYYEIISICDERLELNRDDGDAYYQRAYAMCELNNYVSAIEDYTKAIELDLGFSQELMSALASVFSISENNFESVFRKFANAYHNRGIAKEKLKDYEGAIEDFTKAIEYKSNFANAFHNRGVAKMKVKNFRGATEDFTKVIDFNSGSTSAFFNRGISRFYEMDADFRKALELAIIQNTYLDLQSLDSDTDQNLRTFLDNLISSNN